MSRSAIPTELRRQVLVEAGHRCAVHTCRHPTVDVHHIVPWEQLQEHSFDNLIALCPNCHRRADRGEIDRKALRLYKARAAAGSGLPDSAPIDRLGLESPWTSMVISERRDVPPAYDVAIEIPQFTADAPDLEELNSLLSAWAVSKLAYARRSLVEGPPPADAWWAGKHDHLSASYEIVTFTPLIVSVRCSQFQFVGGAAHPNSWTFTWNFQRHPMLALDLDVMFENDLAALEAIAVYCREHITEAARVRASPDWLERGTRPSHETFAAYNILPDGILVTFDPYQVAPYSEGSIQVLVPKGILRAFLNPRTAVPGLWAE